MNQQKITPCLWFDGQAEAVISLYTSLFTNTRVTDIVRHANGTPGKEGDLLFCTLWLDGVEIKVLNSGYAPEFTPAMSLFVNCDTQEEIDRIWDKIAEKGKEDQCGWITDEFGVSWQIVPTIMGTYLQDPDPERAGRVMKAMMEMVKLDIQTLKDAYERK